MTERLMADKREIAKHNEMKALIVLAKMNNEPMYVTKIIKEGRRILDLNQWEIWKATKPGLRSALTRLEKNGILRSYTAASELRHRETLHYQIVPSLDAFAKIADYYGLSILSVIRKSKFGQLVIVSDLPRYFSQKPDLDEDSLAKQSVLLRDIGNLAQLSARALEILLSPSVRFDQELPPDEPDRTERILTRLRDVMNFAFALDTAVSSRMRLRDEGLEAVLCLSTSARAETARVDIISEIDTAELATGKKTRQGEVRT